MDEKRKVKEFLKKYNMDFTEIDFQEQCEIFLHEMESGLEGQNSSLAMLPTYINITHNIPKEKPVIVIDAGGTNLRTAIVYFEKDGKPIIENFNQYPMPGTYKEVSKGEFFSALADKISPLINVSSQIGFCFSYPMEMEPNRDGRLISFTKEIKAKEVEGQLMGKNLLMTLKNRGYLENKSIVLLNDTAATLLAGKVSAQGRLFDDYMGFILGTGTNACYLEENKRINKLTGFNPKERMIVNVEWGSYNKSPRGQMDDELDQRLNQPGTYLFEKMISGAYLGKLILTVLKKGREDRIFSPGFSEVINGIGDLETKAVNDFLSYPPGPENPLTLCNNRGNREDTILLYWIIDSLLERAALLIAISLTALIVKTGKGHDPCRPVCIAVEGTTFFALKGLKNKIEYYLKKYLNDSLGINYEFVYVEHASLIGAAIAGLTN